MAEQHTSARNVIAVALTVCAAALLVVLLVKPPVGDHADDHGIGGQSNAGNGADPAAGTNSAGGAAQTEDNGTASAPEAGRHAGAQPQGELLAGGADTADPAGDDSGKQAGVGSAAGERAAGAKIMPPERVRSAALHFARQRWQGCRIGPGSPAFAPDGVPEVSFHVVYKDGAAETSAEEIATNVAKWRAERLALEQQLENAPAGQKATLRARIADAWKQMRGDESYSTVVAGTNEGREPFIASFGGLPPHFYLSDDAKDLRRRQLNGADPGEPRVVWLPPVFVVFEFPPAAGRPAAWLEARGTELVEVSLKDWKRQPLPDETAKLRAQKWQALGGAQ